jgi:CDP-glucose 4,6-dehydratase
MEFPVMGEVLRAFRGSRVFLTGHTGFKGSWLAFLLGELGADVMGYALEPATQVNHFELLGLDRSLRHVVGDIRNSVELSSAMRQFRPDFVFHLAAQSLVRPSYDDPVLTFSTNVLGSINLLEAVRHCDSVRSLVFITSDKCYENVEWIWGYRENDQLGGSDPYSASKAAAEIAFASYTRSYFDKVDHLGAASARAGNVIGGGDWALDRIIPDCIRAIERDEPVRLRNPSATRPWQHVLEPLSGYLLLAARLSSDPKRWGGSWNFGPTTREARTVRSVVEVILGHLGKGRVEISTSDTQVHEARLLQLNCDKAHQLLGWHPRWGVDKTLQETALWYKAIMSGCNAEQVTRSQIRDFFPELL